MFCPNYEMYLSDFLVCKVLHLMAMSMIVTHIYEEVLLSLSMSTKQASQMDEVTGGVR